MGVDSDFTKVFERMKAEGQPHRHELADWQGWRIGIGAAAANFKGTINALRGYQNARLLGGIAVAYENDPRIIESIPVETQSGILELRTIINGIQGRGGHQALGDTLYGSRVSVAEYNRVLDFIGQSFPDRG